MALIVTYGGCDHTLTGLYIGSVGFGALIGVFVRLVCRSSIAARLWGIVRGALRSCCVAFPLKSSRRALFSPLLALGRSGVFSVGCERSVRLWAVLEPYTVWVSLPSALPLALIRPSRGRAQ